MNKVYHINLGGYPFTIDDIAYDTLTRYLSHIEDHFRASSDAKEIVSDIEIRIAELIRERTGDREIVSEEDISYAISIMGTPEEFGGEEEEPIGGEFEEPVYQTGKRLFRNPGEKVVAGVCSGISAYFGIHDPIWIRLAFVIVTLAGGSGILLYIILWTLMPEAKTSADRLAMMGVPINVNNIARIVEDGIDAITQQFQEIKTDLKKKSGTRRRQRRRDPDFTPGPGRTAGMRYAPRSRPAADGAIRNIMRGAFLVIALIALLILLGLATGFAFSRPFAPYFLAGSSTMSGLSTIAIFCIAAIPLTLIFLSVGGRAIGRRPSKWLQAGLAVLLIASILTTVRTGIRTGQDFEVQASRTEEVRLGQIGDLLTVNVNEYRDYHGNARFEELIFADQSLISDDVRISFTKGEEDVYVVKQVSKARGKTKDAALRRVAQIRNLFEIRNNELIIPAYFEIPKGQKFRDQEVQIVIEVPISKQLAVEGDFRRYLPVQYDDSLPHGEDLHGQVLTMTESGFVDPGFRQGENDISDL